MRFLVEKQSSNGERRDGNIVGRETTAKVRPHEFAGRTVIKTNHE